LKLMDICSAIRTMTSTTMGTPTKRPELAGGVVALR